MKNVVKWIGLSLVLLVGQIVGGLVATAVAPVPPPGAGDGPLSAFAAIVIINAAFAIVLSALAMRLHWPFWGRVGALFTILYGVDTLQAVIEAIYFNAYLKLSTNTLIIICLGGVIKTILAALAAAALWPRQVSAPQPVSGLLWKLPVIAGLYVIVYFSAGALIAWQGAELRAYYAEGMKIDTMQLGLLQMARGLLWGGLALVVVKSVTGSDAIRIGLTGAAFAVFMAVSLLYPTDFMPWAVRRMHLPEVFLSNLLFGCAAAAILLLRSKASPRTSVHP